MRKPSELLLASLLVACTPVANGAGGGSSPEDTARPPGPLPSLADVHPLRSGAEPLSEQVQGKVVVLDLWATWCAPCRASMPKVARLADAYAATDLVVAGIHVGPSTQGAVRFAEEAGIQYSMHIDPDFAFTDAVGGRSVPLLLVIDRQGTIVHRTHELDAQTLAIVRRLLDG